eukprot:1701585-Rhodomonas_salina.1
MARGLCGHCKEKVWTDQNRMKGSGAPLLLPSAPHAALFDATLSATYPLVLTHMLVCTADPQAVQTNDAIPHTGTYPILKLTTTPPSYQQTHPVSNELLAQPAS